MKYLTTTLIAAGCLTTSAHAQLNGPFWYGGLHGGYYEVTEKGFASSVAFLGDTSFTFEGEDDFDRGYAVGAVLGRQFTPWFGVEAEYTLRNAPFGYEVEIGDDDLETHAFFGNLVFRWPTSKPIEVYGTIGAGLVANSYDLLLRNEETGETERSGTFDDSAAFQIKGGADWFITDRQSFGLEVGWHKGADAEADVSGSDARETFSFEVGGVSALVTLKRRF